MTTGIQRSRAYEARESGVGGGAGSGMPGQLSRREQQTLALIAEGYSNRKAAAVLSVSVSSVGTQLRHALDKLGVERSVDYILGGTNLSNAATRLPGAERLTPAEKKVLRDLVRGLSNAQIGRWRGTSERTIANQVQSAFRKLGVRSRRQLWALAAQHLAQREARIRTATGSSPTAH